MANNTLVNFLLEQRKQLDSFFLEQSFTLLPPQNTLNLNNTEAHLTELLLQHQDAQLTRARELLQYSLAVNDSVSHTLKSLRHAAIKRHSRDSEHVKTSVKALVDALQWLVRVNTRRQTDDEDDDLAWQIVK